MRTIIAASRNCVDENVLLKALDTIKWVPTVVLSVNDWVWHKFSENWANQYNIPIEKYIVNWNNHGKLGSNIRNVEMAKNAEALIALWDGESKGTKHMIETAQKHKLKVFVLIFITNN